MTITLESSVALAGQAEVASKLTITVTGDEVTTATSADDWKRLYGPAYLPSAAGTIVTVGATVKWIVSSIHVVNTDTVARWFQLWTGGTGGSNALTPQFTISAGGCAVYSNEGWRFYDSAGKLQGSQSATGGTPALVLSTSNAAGSSTNFIRDDDQLALFDVTVPVTQAAGDAAATGSAAFAARRDHKHGMPSSFAPSGSAGGDLAGTYPNPTVAQSSAAFALTGDISPTQIAANTDNWAPTGLSTSSVIRLTTDASRNLTGITGGADGRELLLMNVGSFDLVLKHDVTSTAANRFYCPSSVDYTLRTNESVLLVYDSTSSRWRVFDATNTSASTPAAVGTAAAGTAGHQSSRDDHVHPTGAGTPTTSALADAAAIGTGPAAAMTDHKHGRESFATNSIVLGSAAAAGAALTPFRSDDTIAAFDATVPVTQAMSDAAATGSAAKAARRDHKHGMPAGSLNPHGAADHTDITRRFFWPAARTDFDGATSVQLGAVPDVVSTANLADAATQGVYFSAPIPNDAVAAQPLNIVLTWAPGSTDATPHTVRWSVDIKVLSAGVDATAAGTTTAFTGSSAARTANLIVIESSTQVLASVNAGDVLKINVRRLGSDAADTYVGAVRLIMVQFEYTGNQ